jgi:hypothetical protein
VPERRAEWRRARRGVGRRDRGGVRREVTE